MKLPEAPLSWLENTVNACLALDPDFPQRLDALEARTLRVEITGMNLDVAVTIEHRRVTLRQFHGGEADAVIRGSLPSLIRLMISRDPMAAVQEGLVELRGDAQLAREFKKVFDALDIDWEEMLSRVTGDWPARQLGLLAGRLREWYRRSDESVNRMMGEYLQEESQLLPARIEIENFIADVDEIREAADRMEARMDLLKTGDGRA